MGHKNRKTLVKQVSDELDSQFRAGKGRQKHIDKHVEDGMKGRIYTDTTLRTYKKHCCYFTKYCKEQHGCKTLEECREYVPEWMGTRSELSAWTQKLEGCALAKLYGCTTEELGIKTPPRKRTDIKRSRSPTEYDKHFSEEKHKDIVTFGKCSGLRRRELGRIRGTALLRKGDKYFLRITDGTKGRRSRVSPVRGTPEEIELVVRLCREAGDGRIFSKVPHAMDEHSYRKEYCNRVYQAEKRPLETLSEKQKYYCRGDMKGVVYDRRALLRASEALGHSRISVVPSNYTPDM